METKYNRIFPTLVMQAGNVLTNKELDAINASIIKDENEQVFSLNSNSKEAVQSEPFLHKQNAYKPLCKKILELNKKYLTDSNLVFEDLAITDMWSNILKKGQFHRPHTHSNNILSGVFYPKSDNNAKIYFLDPRPQAIVIQPKTRLGTQGNSSLMQYASITNQLLIFPSWLQHYVEAVSGNETRHSVAWNVMLKGLVGDHHSFQSATF